MFVIIYYLKQKSFLVSVNVMSEFFKEKLKNSKFHFPIPIVIRFWIGHIYNRFMACSTCLILALTNECISLSKKLVELAQDLFTNIALLQHVKWSMRNFICVFTLKAFRKKRVQNYYCHNTKICNKKSVYMTTKANQWSGVDLKI